LVRNLHTVAILFDIETAHDTTWEHGIHRDLQNPHCKGQLPNFVKNFLLDRKFSVRLLNRMSDEYDHTYIHHMPIITSRQELCLYCIQTSGQSTVRTSDRCKIPSHQSPLWDLYYIKASK